MRPGYDAMNRVFSIIEAHPEGISGSEIADISGIEGYDLSSCTNRLRQNGEIVRTGRRRDGSTVWAVKS